MPIWLVQIIALFVQEILKEILEDVDWAEAAAKFEQWVRDKVPGERFDNAAAFMARVFFDVLESVLKKNPNLSFKQAAKIARRQLPMALARAAAKKAG